MPSFGRHTRRIGPVICLTANTPGFFARKIPHFLRHSMSLSTKHFLKNRILSVTKPHHIHKVSMIPKKMGYREPVLLLNVNNLAPFLLQ